MRRAKLIALVALMIATASYAEVAVEHTSYEGRDAIRLSNESTDLVIVPSLGRILRYGAKNGPNVLWNCHIGAGEVWKVGQWKNWGGDKVWIWPQEMWPSQSGKAWPPPGDGADQAWQAEIHGKTVRLKGPPFEGFHCRAIREIELSATDSTVTLTTRLESDDTAVPPDVAAWSVTQVPASAHVFAHLAEMPIERETVRGEWPTPKQFGRVLCFGRDGSRGVKTFVEADAFATLQGEHLFVQSVVAPLASNLEYRPLERAQIFSDPDQDQYRPADVPPFIELEFTAPRSNATKTATLSVQWSLQKLSRDEQTPDAVAKCLSRKMEQNDQSKSDISRRE